MNQRYQRQLKGSASGNPQPRPPNRRSRETPHLQFDESEPLSYSDPKAHYHMSESNRNYIDLQTWLGKNKDDAALDVS